MANNSDVLLRIKADIAQAQGELRRMSKDIGGLGTAAERSTSRMSKLGTSLKGLAVAAGVGTALRALLVGNTIEQEQALAQLDARLKSTQGAAGLNRDQLIQMAAAMQRVTTVGDEAVLGAESLLLTFTRIGGEVFPRALEAVLDLSQGMGQDLKSSAILVGKALNDPIKGLSALGRAGVQFTEQQKAQITAMVEAGRVAEAQALILRELETQFGGAARAARDTLGGALKALQNAFGDLLEGDTSTGGIQGARAGIEDLVQLLQDPGTVAAFQGIIALLGGLAGGAVGLAGEVGRAGIAIREQVQIIQGTLPDLQRIDSTLRGIERRRQGPLVGPVQFLFSSDAELDALEAQLKAERALIVARQEADRVGPPTPPPEPPPTINKKYDELLARLREQAALHGEVGEAAKVRYAIENKLLGELDPKQQALLLKYAEQIDAQKQGAEASKKQTAELEALRKTQADYVAGLERNAATVGLTTAQVAQYELAEKGLTGALRARAEAALATIAADEKKRQSDADSMELINVEIALLRAQGREREAAAIEAEQRFGKLRERQAADGNLGGVAAIDNLVAIEQARARLIEVQAQVDAAFERQTRGETRIQAEREAGLISEVGARRELVELHGQTAAEVERLLPEMRALAEATGDPAAIARVQQLTDEVGKLRIAADATGQALREGFETGLTRALEGLIDGTLTLRGALSALFEQMGRAMAQLAAQNLAQEATAGLTRLFGGGAGAQGTELVTGAAAVTGSATALVGGAAAVTGSATALTAASGTLVTGAAAIEAAAAALASAGATGAASSGGGGFLSTIGNWFGSLFSPTGAADGGHIRGPGTSTSDSIPAWLSDNEFVTRAAVVQQPGALGFLREFNRIGMRALEHWSRHATGGLAGFPAPAFALPTDRSAGGRGLKQPDGPRLHVYNFFDRAEFLRAVADTPAGDDFVINTINRNRSRVR